MVKSKEKKYLKTFSIHEKDLSLVHQFSQIILQYKHLENILNILIMELLINIKKNQKQ